MTGRRHRPRPLMAGLTFFAALAALVQAGKSAAPPGEPPSLATGPAEYRGDGGQALGAGGHSELNALTALNFGRRIDIPATPVWCLEVLPGLGPRSAEKAREGGRLSSRAEKALKGLIKENLAETAVCDPNSP